MSLIDSLKDICEIIAVVVVVVVLLVGACYRRNTAIVVLTVVIGLTVGVAYIGWPLISHGTSQALAAYDAVSDPKEKVEAYGKLVAALGLLVAAPFALLGVCLAFWRTCNQHRDSELAARKLETESELAGRKLDAEAFAKAVEQLGHAEIAIRMGAVLALQNLAEASPRRLLGQTLEILCAYVRETRLPTDEADKHPAVPPPTDITLTLEVISRLNRRNADGKIPVDLSNTDLQKAELQRACLAKVNFGNSNLAGAYLWDANLQGANLWKANLQGAILQNANLQGAVLVVAKLEDADLTDANLTGTDLKGAKLQGAFLQGANLADTILEKKSKAGG